MHRSSRGGRRSVDRGIGGDGKRGDRKRGARRIVHGASSANQVIHGSNQPREATANAKTMASSSSADRTFSLLKAPGYHQTRDPRLQGRYSRLHDHRSHHRSGLKAIADSGGSLSDRRFELPCAAAKPSTRFYSLRIICLHLFRFLPRFTIEIGKSCAHTPSFRHRHQPVRGTGPVPPAPPFYQTNLIPFPDTLSRAIPPTQNYQTNPILPPTGRKWTRCRFQTEPDSVSQANCRAHAGWVVRQRRLIKTAS